jgi:hypothetical protein
MNGIKPTTAKRGFFANLVALVERRRYLDSVRELRQNVRPGDRVTYISEDGRQCDGMILDARYYGSGSVEGMFLADDSSTMGWKPSSSFLPIRDMINATAR